MLGIFHLKFIFNAFFLFVYLNKVNVWRRSYDIPPPDCESDSPMLPANDPKYKNIPEAAKIKTESLKVDLLLEWRLM